MAERESPFLIEPEQLRTLLTLIERKTFSGAAEALGVQQSAVSHQVRRMEERLNRKIFRRASTGAELTTDGEALAIYARAMFKLDDGLRRQFQTDTGRSPLRVGIVEDMNRTALPTVLWLFSRDHPTVEFRVASGWPADLLRAVGDGRLDAAIVRHRGELAGVEELWADQLVWIGRDDTPLPIADPIPLVLPPSPSTLSDLVLGSLQAAERTWRIAYEGLGLASLEAGLRAGLGICAFPRSMERFECCELGAAAGLPALPQMRYAMMRAAQPASDAAAAFCEVFREAAQLSFRTQSRQTP